ncbi:MAG: hypothetical protein ACD_75C00533G0008 [uncultured bacterium]|nr:MAG: hypothetical protein ACD_75C00533G0008 [uncultured bacterium]
MNINSVGTRQDQAMLQLKQPNVRGKSGISQELKDTIKAKAETVEASQVQQSEQQGKGVVGLVQEGHFNGVADIRLRINFYDQLQLSAAENSGETLATGSQELVTDLESKIQEFGGTFAIADQEVEDMLTAFKEEADGLIGGIEDGEFDASAVLGGLGTAFEELVTSLQQPVPAPAEEGSGVDTSIVAEESPVAEVDTANGDDAGLVTDTEPSELTVALQSLRDWFATEIETLEKSVDDLQALPDFSEPRGNGVAYNRFLEIYQELQGGTGSDDQEATTTGSTGIEVEA